MTSNFLHLGLISIIFPKAKFIHCTRNPIDTGLSCYFQNFSGNVDFSYNLEDIAFYLSEFLLEHYPERLVDRYQLNSIPTSEIEFLELMGASRGCLRSGGHVDLEKASTILLNEYRAGILGPITLETPGMIAGEEKVVAKEIKEKAEREQLRKEKKHGSRKK